MAAPSFTFHRADPQAQAPDSPGLVPPRTIAVSTTEGVAFSNRVAWFVLENLETDPTVELHWGFTSDGAEGTAYNTLKGGKSVSVPEINSVQTLYLTNPSGAVTVEYQLFCKYTTLPFQAHHAAISEANGFPVFDDSVTTAIQPGIDDAPP